LARIYSLDQQKPELPGANMFIPVRISRDETPGTGTPLVEGYVDKMPFKFTESIEMVVNQPGQNGLASADEPVLQESNQKPTVNSSNLISASISRRNLRQSGISSDQIKF
jgi:hypothetical protein